jgi:hypothetical protein
MTTEVKQIGVTPSDLVEQAAAIRVCSKHIVEDVIEIGRRLTAVKAALEHGQFENWVKQEFSWTSRTALNFVHVYKLSLDNRNTVSDLKLPMRELYLLAAPSTPKEAVAEILDRTEAGEQVSGAEVKETIARAKHKDDPAETDQPAEPADQSVEPADDAAASDTPQETTPTEPEADPPALTESTEPVEPAPDPVATAVAAVNRLTPTELQKFLDRLWPAPKQAFELKFGARNSDKTNAEIAMLVDACSGLLAHPQQNTGEIRKKLASIKALAGGGKARTSNAQLDRSAFKRAIGTAGQPGEKFPTINAVQGTDGIWK